MSDKIWLGAIYLKDEGGYEIILRSLNHYKKRLKTLGSSPELKDSSAMFGSLLQQEAMKTIPKIDGMTKKIKDALSDDITLNSLSEDRSFLVKALSCYESDINKAQNTGHEYFLKLVGDLPFVKKDLDLVKNALDKINQFSD
ncbi:hypothetical protein [Nitrosarchaeum koreense]|uniref:Uncharacterized protein n=1 Tax=Nitrosarchaeum koreense MY1 TaxID=1001994 RepID=F9CWD2_9ARCH|nr:hypothetical protein [Nitrosarchaeum koreense]EGP93584.1 hypothetical protein MY1_0822 [Nitrosarchaeum koreense MY1]